MAPGRPRSHNGLHLKAMNPEMRPTVPSLEKEASHVHPPIVMPLFIGFFVRSFKELRRKIILHDLFRSDNFFGGTVLPPQPRRPSLIHPDFMTEHLFTTVGRNRPQGFRRGSWSRNPSIFCIRNVQAQLKRIFRINLHGLFPWVPGIMSRYFQCDPVSPRETHAAA